MVRVSAYDAKLKRIRERDIATYKFHMEHPSAVLWNARDRRAGYNSRQSVYEAIKRIRKMVEAGDIKVDIIPAKVDEDVIDTV